MKLSHKLIISSSILICISILIGLISIYGMSQINANTQDLSKNWLPTIKIVGELNNSINEYRRNEFVQIMLRDEKTVQQYENKIQEMQGKIEELIKQYEPMITEPEERTSFPEFRQSWILYLENHKKIESLSKLNKQNEAMSLILGDSRDKFLESSKFLKMIIDINNQGSLKSAKEAEEAYSKGKLITIVLLVLGAAIATLGSFILIKGIQAQLGEDPGYLETISSRIANGQLDIQFKAVKGKGGVYGVLVKMVETLKGKIAEAENKSVEALKEAEGARTATTLAEEATRKAESAKAEGMLQAAQQLDSVVEILTSASEELSAQIEQSSRGAEEQGHRIGETATSMEEMNATVLEVARNASSAASSADQAKVKAEEGATVVTKVVQGIEEVRQQSQAMKLDMGSLGTQAEGIGQILNVISDIADQTNLLALNAAIEAARAGDAGRGFAVVADEVRKLAEKTMTATKEVGQAIRGIQDGTKKNIENVERVGKTIEDVTSLANTSGQSLRQIVSLAEVTTDQVRSIATASEQQSAASEEINRSLEDVNRVSAETTDAMRQSAQAVSELANQAQILKRLIDSMKAEGDTRSLDSGMRK